MLLFKIYCKFETILFIISIIPQIYNMKATKDLIEFENSLIATKV